MKTKKVIASLVIAGVVASCGVQSGMIAHATRFSNFGELRDVFVKKEGTDIQFEVVKSGTSHNGTSYAYTTSDENYTYIHVAYKCNTGGSTASIRRVYELNGEVHVDSTIKGVPSGYATTQVISYPYVVAKIAKTDKKVVFDNLPLGSDTNIAYM